MTPLFSPLTLRGLELRNRIGVSPMCQYSSQEGFATDWHLVHIGARAVGGAGMILMEATGVSPEGRISPGCLGIWQDAHIPMLKKITDFAKSQGAAIGIQIAHAGRKASTDLPWNGGKPLSLENGGWQSLGPSPVSFGAGYAVPREMSLADIEKVKKDFVAAAMRAVKAGFQIVELHGAHGYLLNSFFSPLANLRKDAYGGTLENRARLMLEIAGEVRAALPENIILGARLGCFDWKEGGVTLEDTVFLAQKLKTLGIDFIDCSSGGMVPDAKVEVAPNYQVPFAQEIRRKTGLVTAAVGMITEAQQANDIITKGQADLVFLAREMLRDPHWPLRAAKILGASVPAPRQYSRAV